MLKLPTHHSVTIRVKVAKQPHPTYMSQCMGGTGAESLRVSVNIFANSLYLILGAPGISAATNSSSGAYNAASKIRTISRAI